MLSPGYLILLDLCPELLEQAEKPARALNVDGKASRPLRTLIRRSPADAPGAAEHGMAPKMAAHPSLSSSRLKRPLGLLLPMAVL